jgi:hypothetical protein
VQYYDKFGAYAALNHADNFTQAASALAARGYGDRSASPRARGDGSELPEIVVTGTAPRGLAERAWELLGAANEPPRLFVAGGPVRLETDDEQLPIVRPLDSKRIVYELSYIAEWKRRTERGLTPIAPPVSGFVRIDRSAWSRTRSNLRTRSGSKAHSCFSRPFEKTETDDRTDFRLVCVRGRRARRLGGLVRRNERPVARRGQPHNPRRHRPQTHPFSRKAFSMSSRESRHLYGQALPTFGRRR